MQPHRALASFEVCLRGISPAVLVVQFDVVELVDKVVPQLFPIVDGKAFGVFRRGADLDADNGIFDPFGFGQRQSYGIPYSCSSIPLFMGFTGAGLPLGVTFSFLISSPMVDLGSLVLLMSIFGAKVAVLYVLLGLVTIIEKLHMEREVEDFIRSAGSVDIQAPGLTRRDRLVYAREQMVGTFQKVFPYVLVGVGIGAVIHNWIPESWVETVLGSHNPLGVILATVVGVPMYADIFGTIPVAEALLGKGAQLGTVLSFMMAVTTLSLPSLIMLRKAVKPRLLAVFVGICVLGIILVGYFFNAFQFILI